MNKIFVTDMDDVLVDLLSAWCNTLNSRYKRKVTVEDIKDWDMQVVYPDLTDNQVYGILNEDELWKTVKPKCDSVIYLPKIKELGVTVYICTAAHYKNIDTKITNCLLKYYPWLDYKDIIMCHNKAMLKCDYIIDDNPDNIKDSTAIRFLYDCPHNQSADNNTYDYRVTSMKETYEIMRGYEIDAQD